MQIMPIFSVSSVAFFAAGIIASSVVVASSLLVELLVLPVRLFSRALCFGVSRSSLLCLLFQRAHPDFRAVVFRRFVGSAPLPC